MRKFLKIFRSNEIILLMVISITVFLLIHYGRLPGTNTEVVVFVVDTEVDFRFVENLPVEGLQKINHGSIVARVIREEARGITIKSASVDGEDDNLKVEKYLSALRGILEYKQNNPTHKVLVNISLAFDQDNIEHHQIIRDLHQAGVLLVSAAGNDDSEIPVYPAGYANEVITVANANEEGRAPSSNYGEFIDISAPGSVEFIAHQYFPGQVWIKTLKAEGTSFSAPRIVGLIANILDQKTDLTIREALNIVLENTEPISDPMFFKKKLGIGVINKEKILTSIDSQRWLNSYTTIFIVLSCLLLFGVIAVSWPQKFIIIFFGILVGIPFVLLIGDRALFVYNLWRNMGFEMIDLFWWGGLIFVVLALTGWNKIFVGCIWCIIFGGMVGTKASGFSSGVIDFRLVGLCIVWIFIGMERFLIFHVNVSGKDYDSLINHIWSLSSKVANVARARLISLGEEAVEKLIITIESVKSERKLILLLRTLEEFVSPKAKNTLPYYLYHPSLKVRKQVCKIILNRDKMPINTLLTFGIENFGFSELIITHIIRIGESSIPELISILEENQLEKKRLAGKILSEINSEKVLEKIEEELVQNSNLDQQILLEILEKYGTEASRFVKKVYDMFVQETEMWLRYQALHTLAAIHPEPQQLELLLRSLTHDSQELVRCEAKGLLRDLSQKDL